MAVAWCGLYAFSASALAADAVVNAQGGSWDLSTVNLSDGDMVTWNNPGQGSHNVRIAGENAPLVAVGENWTGIQKEFTRPGTAIFYCEVHGSASGAGMAGTVNVAGISGRVVRDSDGSGTITAADDATAGVTVRVYDKLAYEGDPQATPPLDTTTTDGEGLYEFEPPMPAFGFAKVIVEPPAGFAPPAPLDFASNSTSADGDKDFLLEGTGSVSGTVWNDVNGNGVHDGPEAGRAGVSVSLNGKRTATTAADGTYSFAEAIPGAGTVSITAPSGFGTVGTASRAINLQNPDYSAIDQDFFVQQLGSIGGVVYDDVDGSGTATAGDGRLANVTLGLDSTGDGVPDTTAVSSADGSYAFSSLAPRAYRVVFTVPAGHQNTGPAAFDVTLAAGDSAPNANFFARVPPAAPTTQDPPPPAPPADEDPGPIVELIPSRNGTSANDLLNGTDGADRILGLGGADVLLGLLGNDHLDGGAGNDNLDGGAGNDTLRGGSGNDSVTGGTGNDRLSGMAGRDKLSGGSGRDTLDGGKGKDRMNAGAGNDSVNSKDGVAELVNCGAGKDRVKADRKDRLRSCEKRSR